MHGHAADLTDSVQNGLGYYYGICALMNVGFAFYQQFSQKQFAKALIWYLFAALFVVLAIGNFGHQGWMLPLWLKDTSDLGLERGLVTLGVGSAGETGANATINATVSIFNGIMWFVIIAGALDILASYVIGGGARKMADSVTSFSVFGKLTTESRAIVWTVLIAIFTLLLFGTNAITSFIASIAGLGAFVVWRKTLTAPNVIWLILNLGLIFGGFSMTDADFREIIIKPDNVPIVFLVFVVGFFTWLYFRRSVINDDRIAQGKPPLEKEDDEKVLVWPDLVYTEMICMVVVTVLLIVWAVALPAPLEQPASATNTPNPSKAPWYFLGLQEMLVYYDPWIAGVVLPTIIIIGLMALPYIDYNQKGNGYFTFNERPFAILTFLFGFIVLWVTLIFLGTFLRGPNWNFFGLYEPRDPHKLVPLNNVDLSEYIWIRWLGIVWNATGEDGPRPLVILIRELPGILLVLGYFLLLPPLMAKTMFRKFFVRMGFIRCFILINLVLWMASLPIKMVLRWAINLKYIVSIPEYFFNI